MENAIGRLRRFLPRRTDLKKAPAAELAGVVGAYPDLFISPTPRRCLGYRTPAEVFTANDALRLHCESAFRRKPE